MEELDVQSEQLLALARRRMSPTLDDQLRLREMLAARHPQPNAPGASRRPRTWGPLLATAVFFGAAGFYAGYRVSRDGSSPAQAPVRAPAPARPAPQAAPSGAPAVEKPALELAREPAATPDPAPMVKRSRSRTPSDTTAPNGAPETPSPSLQLELEGVRRMELALREGQPALALSILDELDRDVPKGRLEEERRAGFVMARCGVGLGSPAALLREFESQHPESMYLERVRRHCTPKPR